MIHPQDYILETKRLLLRELMPADAEQLYLLNSDEEVIRYTGDSAFSSVEAAHHFLENYSHYRHYGFGRWAVIRKSDKEFLGWCGLKYSEDLKEHDIGFRFFKSFWNQGYATEAAMACIEAGFEDFDMTCIVGRAMKRNTASIRVLKKLGMTLSRTSTLHEEEWMIYQLEKH